MYPHDPRPEHLGWIETALRAKNRDLPYLRLSAQSHVGPFDRIAFISVSGLDNDRDRRRQIRATANNFFRVLGYSVELEPGRDVYDVTAKRPTSAHDEIRMLEALRLACEAQVGKRYFCKTIS